MQISQLRKLLHPIKRLTSRRAEKPSAETLESRAESDVEMQNAEQMQNSECRMQNAEQMQNAECKMQNEEVISEAADNCSEDMPTEAETTPETPSPTVNTKAHLTSSVPRAARLPQGALTKGQMAEIREIFGDIDDAEIQRLYKRVTK